MILLDTNAFIRLATGQKMRVAAADAIDRALGANALLVSSVTAWEIGLLAVRTGRTGPSLGQDARTWFHLAVVATRVRLIAFEAEAALEAALLPEWSHWDPSDRMLVATARLTGFPLATTDGAILDYAAAGHVRAIAC